jgi:Bacterial SH3 domain
MNSIRDLVGNLSGINAYVEEARRAARDAMINSGAQQAWQSIQREQRRVLEQAVQLTNVAETIRKQSAVDELLHWKRQAISATHAIADSMGITQQFARNQRDFLGLNSVTAGLRDMQSLSSSVASRFAELNLAERLDTEKLQQAALGAAHRAAASSAVSAYQDYFSGIEKERQKLLDSVSSFANQDSELASRIASLASFDSIQGLADSQALKSLVANQRQAFSSLSSVINSFASAIANPSAHLSLLSASQAFSESSRRLIDDVANIQGVANQQALSNIVSLVDFATARALHAASHPTITKPRRMTSRRQRRRSLNRSNPLQAQLQELVVISNTNEQLVAVMQPVHEKLHAIGQKVDGSFELGTANALTLLNKSSAEFWRWITTILLALAAFAHNHYLANIKPAPVPTSYVTANGVNLRAGPSTTQSVITSLALNEVVEIKSKQHVWIQVVANTSNGARVGWVHQRYLKTVEPNASPAP